MRAGIWEEAIGLVGVLIISILLWALIGAAVFHLAGCSLSLALESEVHHRAGEVEETAEPTPTPAPGVH